MFAMPMPGVRVRACHAFAFASWLRLAYPCASAMSACPEKRHNHTFDFIAHYNRAGFVNTYFRNDQTRLHFVTNLLNYPFAGVNPDYTYHGHKLVLPPSQFVRMISGKCTGDGGMDVGVGVPRITSRS